MTSCLICIAKPLSSVLAAALRRLGAEALRRASLSERTRPGGGQRRLGPVGRRSRRCAYVTCVERESIRGQSRYVSRALVPG